MKNKNQEQIEKTDIIQKRRSIREFEDQPIDYKTLEKIIQAASMAPSALNTQPWKFLAVCDEIKKRQIRQVYDNSTKTLMLLKKLHLTNAQIYDQNTEFLEKATLIVPIYEKNIPYARESTCFATQNLMLKATELELGSCCTARALSLFTGKRKIKKILNISNNYDPVFIVAVGHPKKQITEYSIPKRKTLNEIVTVYAGLRENLKEMTGFYHLLEKRLKNTELSESKKEFLEGLKNSTRDIYADLKEKAQEQGIDTREYDEKMSINIERINGQSK